MICFSPSKVHHILETRIYFIIVSLIAYISFKISIVYVFSHLTNSSTSSFIDIKELSYNISYFLWFFFFYFVLSSYLSWCLKYLLIHNWRLDFDILNHFTMKSMLLYSASYKLFMIKKLTANLLKLLDFNFSVFICFVSNAFGNLLRSQYPQFCLASRCVLINIHI